MVCILARVHMALTWKSLGLLIHLRSFHFSLWWSKKISRSLNILIPAYPVVLHIMIQGLVFPFVNFHYHPKRLTRWGSRTTLISGIKLLRVKRCFKIFLKMLNTKMIYIKYEIFFDVRFPTSNFY